MYFGYVLYVCSAVLMLMDGECFAVKHGVAINQTISNETEKTRPNVSSGYCLDKFSCSGNHTKSCYCDSLCKVMGDCCKGYETNITLDKIPEKSLYSCYRMPKLSTGNAFGALVVAACPTDWSDDGSRSLCEKRRRRVELDNTYVNNDGVVFKKLFCAFCNNMLPHTYSIGELKICSHKSHDEKMKNTVMCSDLYDKRAQINTIRACSLRMTNNCPFGTADDMSEMCTSGEYGIVYDADGNMYRNIYCGLCYGISGENLSCEKDKVVVGVPYAFSKLIVNEEIQKVPSDENISDKGSRDGINATKMTNSNEDNAHAYLTLVVLVISILSLIITLVVYKCFPILMNTPGKITFCLALSLLLAQLLFLISSETERIPWLCIKMAVLVHFFFLAAFCWMNIIAFDLWMTFAHHIFDVDEKRKFYYYNVYAWLVPALIVVIAVIFNFSERVGSFSPQYGENGCWIFSENAKLLFFIGPLALFKLFDIVAFSCTVYFIRKSTREASFAREGKGNTCLFFINVKLSLIMGLTWTFAFLAKYSDSDVLLYLFTIFNALQGFFIFVCFVCTKKVFKLISKWFRRKDPSTNSHIMSFSNTRSTSI